MINYRSYVGGGGGGGGGGVPQHTGRTYSNIDSGINIVPTIFFGSGQHIFPTDIQCLNARPTFEKTAYCTVNLLSNSGGTNIED